MADYNTLYLEFLKETEKANRYLLRLEKLAQNPEYSAVLDYAYRNAQADIKALGAKGKRFSVAKPKNIREMQTRINAAKRFTEKPTATKTGIDRIYGKRAKSFSKGAGADMDWKQMANVFESGLWETLKEKFGSKTAQRMVGKIERNRDTIKEAIAKGEAIKFTNQYSRGLNELFGAGGDTQNIQMLTRYLGL